MEGLGGVAELRIVACSQDALDYSAEHSRFSIHSLSNWFFLYFDTPCAAFSGRLAQGLSIFLFHFAFDTTDVIQKVKRTLKCRC